MLNPAPAGGGGPSSVLCHDGILDTFYVRMTGNGVDANTLSIVSTRTGHPTVTRVYELDTAAAPGAITAGRVRVDISGGATAAQTVTALVAAINGDGDRVCEAVDIGGDVCALIAMTTDSQLTATVVLTNGVLSAAAAVGAQAEVGFGLTPINYTATAENVTAWAVPAQVTVGGIESTATPIVVSACIVSAAGGIKSAATVDVIPTQVNGNNWLIAVGDAGATMANTDLLRLLILTAVE
ncbi:MAG: hypothetical protein ABII82_01940 [Verrucomicrobiota bacterium]